VSLFLTLSAMNSLFHVVFEPTTPATPHKTITGFVIGSAVRDWPQPRAA
jgi:hypothetical protein